MAIMQGEDGITGCTEKFVIVCDYADDHTLLFETVDLSGNACHVGIVQAAGRLVHDKGLCAVQQAGGNRRALSLPTGQRQGMALGEVCQTKVFHK